MSYPSQGPHSSQGQPITFKKQIYMSVNVKIKNDKIFLKTNLMTVSLFSSYFTSLQQ
jgi:hypothetical protein